MPPRRPDDDFRVMPWWLVAVGLAAALLAGGLVLTWLLHEAEAGDPAAGLRIDAIRTSLAVVAGTGGATALLLAARRQWLKERAQRHEEAVASQHRIREERAQAHREEVAAAEQKHRLRQALNAEHEATERRVTDLYASAVNLLGSDRPAIRTAGLYALERLAQDHDAHRQTIVEVICAYLRLPAAGGGEPGDEGEAHVRTTALRLLARHLRREEPRFWPDIQLDLSGAQLTDVDFSGCEVGSADLSGAVLAGTARFAGTVVHGPLVLSGARFGAVDFEAVRVHGRATLDFASFAGQAVFDRMEFGRGASFHHARFQADVSFNGAKFARSAVFDRARFDGDARFFETWFEGRLSIEHATFAGAVTFNRARFTDLVLLRWTVFESEALFEEARFEDALNLARVEFHNAAVFGGATLRRRPQLDRTLAAASVRHEFPAGLVTAPAGGTIPVGEGDWLLVREATSDAATGGGVLGRDGQTDQPD